MTKYIFLPGPAYGHVNPTLAIAQKLVRRGEQVVYYLTEEFQATIEATGAISQITYPSKLEPTPITSVYPNESYVPGSWQPGSP